MIFGGGRLRVNVKDIPLDVDALFTVYDEANTNAAAGKQAVPAPVSGKGSRSSRRKAGSPSTGVDRPQDNPEDGQTVNNTSEQEKIQEAHEMNAGDGQENADDKPVVIPAEEAEELPAEKPTEQPGGIGADKPQEERTRRRRRARD